jgi:alkylation response protein AidB-like acyl-CoA dehydrogenase
MGDRKRGVGQTRDVSSPADAREHDPLAPNVAASAHPLVVAAQRVADDFAADADVVERTGVTRARLDVAASAGLATPWLDPATGEAVPAEVTRTIVELIAGACPSTWFVLTQHRSAWESATLTDVAVLRERWAMPLSTGRALGAVAFAHLRRPGPPQVVATRDGDGWRVSGRLDWITGWGVTDVLALMVETPDGQVLQTLIPAESRPGLAVTPPLDLLAMGATSTVGASLDALRIEPDEVALTLDKDDWTAIDRQRTANAVPAVFGMIRAICRDLADVAERRGDHEAAEVAQRIAARAAGGRASAYALIDDADPEERTDERVRLRADSLALLSAAARALVIASGGRALDGASRPARWSREAMFMNVQAQTGSLRSAQLAELLDD